MTKTAGCVARCRDEVRRQDGAVGCDFGWSGERFRVARHRRRYDNSLGARLASLPHQSATASTQPARVYVSSHRDTPRTCLDHTRRPLTVQLSLLLYSIDRPFCERDLMFCACFFFFICQLTLRRPSTDILETFSHDVASALKEALLCRFPIIYLIDEAKVPNFTK